MAHGQAHRQAHGQVHGRVHRARQASWLIVVATLAVVLAGCSGGLILANPPLAAPAPPTATPAPSRPADPVAIVFPRDDGPHDRLTEWWYYTGHLVTADGRRFGFEAVIFRAERGDVPVTWASHVALTDEAGNRFTYGQRSEIGPQADHSPRDSAGVPSGFDLTVTGDLDRTAAPWELAGSGGRDHITAALTPAEATVAGRAFGLDLRLSSTKPPALHGQSGWVQFGPAGGSYYYSRTRLTVTGTLTLDGASMAVTGLAWFDHQWGDFISVGGGWDWFAVNLDNGDDYTISRIRSADGTTAFTYGTYVAANGYVAAIPDRAGIVQPTGTWTSPHTGAVYPSGWSLVPQLDSRLGPIRLDPTVADQELDTRATTGVVYWEGSQRVSASIMPGPPIGGEAYVELTGYAPGASSSP